MSEHGSRPRLLVLNQYYWPGVEATAHLLTELCEALTEDFEVTVVTGMLHGHEESPHEEVRHGVRIARELKRLENPIAIGVLRQLVGLYLRRADRIVAIGETMRRRLEEKGAPP